jgi:lipopolysaccharide export system protein LptA
MCSFLSGSTILLGSSLIALSIPLPAVAAPQGEVTSSNEALLNTDGFFEFGKSDEPTFINSDSLQLDTQKRIFFYRGNVKVIQGDLTLTSEELEGRYNSNNEIEQLIAKRSVNIIKGESINATSNKAVYTASNEVLTLTENPQILQGTSLLTADVVKIYLQENRSEAEGQVRVKMIKDEKTPKPAPAQAKTPETSGKTTTEQTSQTTSSVLKSTKSAS